MSLFLKEPLSKVPQVILCLHSIERKADSVSRGMTLSEPFYLITSFKSPIVAYLVVTLSFLFSLSHFLLFKNLLPLV